MNCDQKETLDAIDGFDIVFVEISDLEFPSLTFCDIFSLDRKLAYYKAYYKSGLKMD